MKKLRKILFFGVLSVFLSCWSSKQNKNTIKVDFEQSTYPSNMNKNLDSLSEIKVAVSAIISPRETFNYYDDLFTYISHRMGYKLKFKQRKTYQEVNDMLYRHEFYLAFICSGAYVKEKKRSNIEILAVPVCNGKAMYQAYIITYKSSGIKKFIDLRGKSFAFTDPLSNTGKLYVDNRLCKLNTNEKQFFSSVLYTHAHDISIQLVSKMLVDGASVDGLIFNYIAKKNPKKVRNIRIIKKSEYFGIPPIVVTSNLSPKLKKKLRDIFLSLDKDSVGIKILKKLMIMKFIEGTDTSYNSIRRMNYMIDK